AWRTPLGKGLGYTAGMPILLNKGQAFSEVETLNVDSGIGAAAAELGILGVLIFLYLLLQLASCPLQSWRRIPEGALKDLMLVPVTFALTFSITSVLVPMSASLPYS